MGPKRGPSPRRGPAGARSRAAARAARARRSERPELGRAVEEARLVVVADRIGLAQRRDGDHARRRPRQRAARARARSGPVGPRGLRRARRSFWSWPRLSVIPHDAATVSRAVRRIVLTGVVALCCCSAASGGACSRIPGSRSPRARAPSRGLQAYPRTLSSSTTSAARAAVPALRRAGGRLIEPSARALAPAELDRAALLPGLQRRGLVRSVTPDVPIGTDPRGASGFFGQFTDPLSPQEWWPSHIGVSDWIAPGPGRPRDDDRLRRRPLARGVRRAAEHDRAKQQTFDANQTRSCTAPRPPRSSARPSTARGSSASTRRRSSSSGTRARPAQLTVGDEIAGLAAARRHGQGVINLSLGGFDRLPIEEHAIMSAFGAGLLVVASAGNDRRGGQPALLPRKLRACADGRRDRRGRPRDRLLQLLAGDGPRRARGRTSRPRSRPSSTRAATPRSTARASRPRSSPAPPRRSGRCGRRCRTHSSSRSCAARRAMSARRAGTRHRLRYPRRPRRVDAQAAGRRPAGAERGRLPGKAERAHARRQDAAHCAAPAARRRSAPSSSGARTRRTSTASTCRRKARSSSPCGRTRTSASSSGARRRRPSSSRAPRPNATCSPSRPMRAHGSSASR